MNFNIGDDLVYPLLKSLEITKKAKLKILGLEFLYEVIIK